MSTRIRPRAPLRASRPLHLERRDALAARARRSLRPRRVRRPLRHRPRAPARRSLARSRPADEASQPRAPPATTAASRDAKPNARGPSTTWCSCPASRSRSTIPNPPGRRTRWRLACGSSSRPTSASPGRMRAAREGRRGPHRCAPPRRDSGSNSAAGRRSASTRDWEELAPLVDRVELFNRHGRVHLGGRAPAARRRLRRLPRRSTTSPRGRRFCPASRARRRSSTTCAPPGPRICCPSGPSPPAGRRLSL